MRVERERAHPAREERKHLLRAEAIPCFQAKGKLSALPSLSFFRNALAFADNPCAKKSFFSRDCIGFCFLRHSQSSSWATCTQQLAN